MRETLIRRKKKVFIQDEDTILKNKGEQYY